MKVLVSGDRNWTDWQFVYRALDAIRADLPEDEMLIVIHGAAAGADTFAGNWALDRRRKKNVDVEEYPAHWRHGPHCKSDCRKMVGRAAGPIRNKEMLDEGKPDLVMAFHDAITSSKGTKDMIARAEKEGIEVWLLGHPDRLYDGGSDD